MPSFGKRLNMRHLIVSDIFGNTKALQELSHSLIGENEFFDPYNSETMNFSSEKQAYDYFSNEIGLEAYASKLLRRIVDIDEPTSLVGFSVGASAIWKISSSNQLNHVTEAICFYGSKIRHYIDIIPNFPIQLVFPKSEESFCVDNLISKLRSTKNVIIDHSSYLHGFMNSHSQNFNNKPYEYYIQNLNKQSRII